LGEGLLEAGTKRFGPRLLSLLGRRGAARGAGEAFDLALGLSRHPDHAAAGLLGRFAEHVNAKTYWDFFENTTDMRLLGGRTLQLMEDAEHIHFNLDGMLRSGTTIEDLTRWGAEGIGQGNVTNWELSQVLQRFAGKTTLHP
jgi:hypothetical protein